MRTYLACCILLMLCAHTGSCQSSSAGTNYPANPYPGFYTETHRPQFHFSPKEKWMNDPNGMVYFEGEYHLFYQYYPDSTVWGPMHWGHAVSTDLIYWAHLPIALYPDSLGYIFSGSAVVDWKNSSGFGEADQPPLVAIFTYHQPVLAEAGRQDFQYQGIAYSNDKGRTWTKYSGNPVIPNTQQIRDFRDPKVIWDASSNQWIMVFAAYDHVKFWASKDLKNWKELPGFGKNFGVHSGVWECPDLFPIIHAQTGEQKWVLLVSMNPGAPNGGSGTQYFIGNFDGAAFTLDPSFMPLVTGNKAVWIDYGRDNYAGVTWSDIPKQDGRRLFLGWMSNWDYATVVPTSTWRSAMTLPRTLTLQNTPAGARIYAHPVEETKQLRIDSVRIPAKTLIGKQQLNRDTWAKGPKQLELELEFEIPDGSAPDFGVEWSNALGEYYRIGYTAATQQFYSDRTKAGKHTFSDKFAPKIHWAPRIAPSNRVRLHLFFDVASSELFADGGATVLTDIFFPTQPFNQVHIYSNNGAVQLVQGKGYTLKSIWK